MPSSRSKRFDLFAVLLSVLAVIVVVQALNQLEIHAISSRDSLKRTPVPSLIHHHPQAIVKQADRGSSMQDQEKLEDQQRLDKTPYKINVGLYPITNYGVDFTVPSFHSTGYIWYKWSDAFQEYLTKNKYKIEELLVPINSIGQQRSTVISPLGQGAIKLPDGNYYGFYSYEGNFYIDTLDFHKFPFNTLSLPIMIEADDQDGTLDYGGLRLLPEHDSAIGGFTEISGWEILGTSFSEYKHHLGSEFGLSQGEYDYSQAVFDVNYGTSVWAAFWKLVQPILVQMVMVVLVVKLPRDLDDLRVGVPVYVLLTLVFTQVGYQSSQPSLPYLSFLDKVYVVCYAVSTFTFALTVWSSRQHHRLEDQENTDSATMINRRLSIVDNVWPPAVLTAMLAAVFIIWQTSQ
jgi:hypothetical protein